MTKLYSLLFFIRTNIALCILTIICLLGSLIILAEGSFVHQNHYVGLAQSFINGRLDIPNLWEYSATGDISFFKDKHYVYFGPAPAFLIMPFVVLFGDNIPQHFIGLTLFFLDFFLIYKIARYYKIPNSGCIWLTIFFIFGTTFFTVSLIDITSYLVQLIATSFLILALYIYLYHRNLLLFFTPILIGLIIIGFYNQIRFNSFFDTGYSYEMSLPKYLSEAKSHGLFSIEHIPGNLYFLLFKSPEPVRTNDQNYILRFPYLKASPWGMGIFFTSPLFLYLLFCKIKAKHTISSLITVLVMLMPLLSFYGIGIWQFGYRYAIDFYPFLFLIVLPIFSNGVPVKARLIIFCSVIFNLFFTMSIWDIYPFLPKYFYSP